MTALPAVFPVISMAWRIGTPAVVREENVRESVKGGGSIATPMRAEPAAFPQMVTQMVGVGEETGALETMLSKIADFYEDQVDAAIKALTSILEPAMIILVGSIVGVIVVSMYLPLFSVYNSIK